MKYNKTVTREQMEQALAVINKKYDGNIVFHPETDFGSRRFRLFTVDADKPGARRHYNPFNQKNQWRRGRSACWHVHGDFFDALFAINPDAAIRTGGRKITKEDGNWEDRNIGSQMYPVLHSESCRCGLED